MSSKEFPKYAEPKHKGNIGEAIAQYHFSRFALVHKIDGSNDIGNDFICELIKDEAPTNLLFYVQVKYCQSKPRISQKTMKYWKGSPIPVFVFWIQDGNFQPPNGAGPGAIKYLRITPFLHSNEYRQREIDSYQSYIEQSFKRDLLNDYKTCQYANGNIPIIDPRSYFNIDEKITMGLERYIIHVEEIVLNYADKIKQQAWLVNYTIANVLRIKPNRKNLRNAKKAIDLAISLMSKSERVKYKAHYHQMVNLKIEIEEKLDHS